MSDTLNADTPLISYADLDPATAVEPLDLLAVYQQDGVLRSCTRTQFFAGAGLPLFNTMGQQDTITVTVNGVPGLMTLANLGALLGIYVLPPAPSAGPFTSDFSSDFGGGTTSSGGVGSGGANGGGNFNSAFSGDFN